MSIHVTIMDEDAREELWSGDMPQVPNWGDEICWQPDSLRSYEVKAVTWFWSEAEPPVMGYEWTAVLEVAEQ